MLSIEEINKQTITLIKSANEKELVSLSKIIDNSDDIKARSEQQIFEQLFGSGYVSSLTHVAKKLKVNYQEKHYHVNNKGMSIRKVVELEEAILKKVLKLSYENMSEDDRKEYDKKIKEIAVNHGISSTSIFGAAGLMTVANLGGFTTYMLMSSFLSVVSFGTLGFGAYTAASSILSTIIGPVGWAALGVYALYKWSQPNYEKLIPAVITVSLIRQRIEFEREQARLAEIKKRSQSKRSKLKMLVNTSSIESKDKGLIFVKFVFTLVTVFYLLYLLVMFS
ncbi:hypothetical protein [Thalassotalea piscium]|uniref:Uncharacterized protein YaaW (UPF0174 family) n=1 Tax=Thalassotalea piscium TaxID=1230533 RepID=A0A7X0NKH6_9GAMM|nr:hypothetical protein [Thalassotalea piscium]MBB6545124.1 uncharacterized protein YaaW (UPF0174 family) [Thalassotalea piscium]